MRSAKRNRRHPRCRNTRYGTASGRNDSTNKNLHEKNSAMIGRQPPDHRLASLSSTGIDESRVLRERVDELDSEKAKIAGRLLAQHTSGDGRSLIRHQARCRGRGRGNGQLDNLFSLKNMRGGDTGAGGADIESLCQLDKINTQSVGTPQEYGNLNANTWVLPLVGEGHRFLSIQDLTWHFALFSTVELVRYKHTKCHCDGRRMHSK